MRILVRVLRHLEAAIPFIFSFPYKLLSSDYYERKCALKMSDDDCIFLVSQKRGNSHVTFATNANDLLHY